LKPIEWAVLGLFLIVAAASIASLSGLMRLPVDAGICDAAMLALAAGAVLLSMCRQLPAQNVLLAVVIAAVVGSVVRSVGVITGIPFGPIIYQPDVGPQLLNTLPWCDPLIWVTAIFASRGVARLILRPWRKLHVYGFWLMGLTTLLTVLLDLGLEPFATRAAHYWIWQQTKLPIDWYGTPVSNFLGWPVTTVLILAFATPSLMKKKPAKSGGHYGSLIVWTGLNLIFIAAAVSQHFWLAAIVSGAACVVAVSFAVRGAVW
jgi:uncharacterized membrane protein